MENTYPYLAHIPTCCHVLVTMVSNQFHLITRSQSFAVLLRGSVMVL